MHPSGVLYLVAEGLCGNLHKYPNFRVSRARKRVVNHKKETP